jgi:hydroxymethylbilane synthase
MIPLRIGTRGSALALWQANFVADRLRAVAPERTFDIVEIQTTGDQAHGLPLAQIGGEGVFTKAIQQALLDNRVDVAVHSLKDLPTARVAGLVLAAVPPRGPNGDAFVSRRHASFAVLPARAVVATSSLRRRAQILHRRPDLQVIDIRGNVETRLRKLAEQNIDGLLLAHAGLMRLGLDQEITELLDPAWMLPAVGQGALGVECRVADGETRAILERLDDPATHAAVVAERSMLHALGGGCHVPIGAASAVTGDNLSLRGTVLSPDGQERMVHEIQGRCKGAIHVGESLARTLLEMGARRLLTY